MYQDHHKTHLQRYTHVNRQNFAFFIKVRPRNQPFCYTGRRRGRERERGEREEGEGGEGEEKGKEPEP